MNRRIVESFYMRMKARWRCTQSFTAVIPLTGCDAQEVQDELCKVSDEIHQQLAHIGDCHFFRMVVATPNSRTGDGTRLLINTVFDHSLDQQLQAIEQHLGPLIQALLTQFGCWKADDHCIALLLKYRIKENALFVGAVNKTVGSIDQERNLRDALAEHMDAQEQVGAWVGKNSEQVRLLLRDFAQQSLRGPGYPQGKDPALGFYARFLQVCDLILIFTFFPIVGVLGKDVCLRLQQIGKTPWRWCCWLLFAVWWLWGAVFTAVALVVVRIMEQIETEHPAPEIAADALQMIEAGEDYKPRNELTAWFPVRESMIGRLLMRLILFGSDCGCRHFWNKGTLAGAQNIHFARLIQLDKGRSMIFMSDYEGSFDAYVDHFVGIGGNHRAVVPISSRLDACPKTRWLYWQKAPAHFRPQWKKLIRSTQIKAAIWYSAYPGLTANDVLANSHIREGLFADHLSPQQAQRWTQLFT